jgi:tetratricopeptide (TPR) repeat protein
LWRWQRQYYEKKGITAWSDAVVPHYITSNPYIAASYARVIAGFIEDIRQLPDYDPQSPITIIELGTGSGRFSYNFMKAFFENGLYDSATPVRYVMTDFAQANIDFWQDNEQLKPFVGLGLLDYAVFDVEQGKELRLINSRQTLNKHTLRNPIIVIANYIFDSIPFDMFVVKDHEMSACLVDLALEGGEEADEEGKRTGRLSVAYNLISCSAGYYENPIWDKILHEYPPQFEQTCLLFPTAAFSCLERLLGMSNGKMLLISGDKGSVSINDLDRRDIPVPVMHGSISYSVNFHAISRFTELNQGTALTTTYDATSLNVAAFLFGNDAPTGYAHTRRSYKQCIEEAGPDDYFLVTKQLCKQSSEITLEDVFALLRLSHGDMRIFEDCYDRLIDLLREATYDHKQYLISLIPKVWDGYYRLADGKNPAFLLATILAACEAYELAIDFYKLSQRLVGNSGFTEFNLGLCYLENDEPEKGIQSLKKAIELDPDLNEAKAVLEELLSGGDPLA